MGSTGLAACAGHVVAYRADIILGDVMLGSRACALADVEPADSALVVMREAPGPGGLHRAAGLACHVAHVLSGSFPHRHVIAIGDGDAGGAASGIALSGAEVVYDARGELDALLAPGDIACSETPMGTSQLTYVGEGNGRLALERACWDASVGLVGCLFALGLAGRVGEEGLVRLLSMGREELLAPCRPSAFAAVLRPTASPPREAVLVEEQARRMRDYAEIWKRLAGDGLRAAADGDFSPGELVEIGERAGVGAAIEALSLGVPLEDLVA